MISGRGRAARQTFPTPVVRAAGRPAFRGGADSLSPPPTPGEECFSCPGLRLRHTVWRGRAGAWGALLRQSRRRGLSGSKPRGQGPGTMAPTRPRADALPRFPALQACSQRDPVGLSSALPTAGSGVQRVCLKSLATHVARGAFATLALQLAPPTDPVFALGDAELLGIVSKVSLRLRPSKGGVKRPERPRTVLAKPSLPPVQRGGDVGPDAEPPRSLTAPLPPGVGPPHRPPSNTANDEAGSAGLLGPPSPIRKPAAESAGRWGPSQEVA